jgi:hypothetical protein
MTRSGSIGGLEGHGVRNYVVDQRVCMSIVARDG